MNEHDPSSPNSSQQGPSDPRGTMAPPPPPPAPPGSPMYPYPAPQPPKRGLLGNIRGVGAAISIGLLVFLAGFYVAMFQLAGISGVQRSTYREGEGNQRIAIIPINGTISSATAGYVHDVVEAIEKDDTIKSIVLRVQSPGGGATASDQILHELNKLRDKTKLPIVASYGDYAASGGYYVSCQSDYIFAEPTTITGSIGVLAQVPTMQDLLEKKLGVKFEVITADDAPEKQTANNLFRDWTDKDRAVMRNMVNAIYQQFYDVVSKGRSDKIDPQTLKTIANGSIYTAQEAVANKLVDEIGYLDAALEKARVLGGIAQDKPPVVYYHPRQSLLQRIGVTGPSPTRSSASLETVLDANRMRTWLDDMSVPRVMYMFKP